MTVRGCGLCHNENRWCPRSPSECGYIGGTVLPLATGMVVDMTGSFVIALAIGAVITVTGTGIL